MASYVIVGASRGIGYQFLKTLSKDKSNTVVGVVRNKGATQSLLEGDNLSSVHLVTADMTDPKALTIAANETADLTGGSVDYLIVNGAYLGAETELMKPTDYIGKENFFKDELTSSFMTNVAGVLYTVNAFLPLIRAGSVKKVVVLSTGMADPEFIDFAGVSGGIAYTASKAAVNTLVQKYAIELKPEGITFLALSPGLVNSKDISFEDMPPEQVAIFSELIKTFQNYEPTFRGPITPTESVDMQLEVIHKVTPAQSGSFLSHKGNKRWL